MPQLQSPLIPIQVRLCGSGVPHDSPLEDHSLWDFALTTPGSARSSLFYFILFYFILFYFILQSPLLGYHMCLGDDVP